MMWHVVRMADIRHLGGGGACATRRAVGIDDAQVEAAFEPAPGHTTSVQKVTDVLSTELHLRTSGGGAHIAQRIGVVD